MAESRGARSILLGVNLKQYLDGPETLAWVRSVATIARGTAAIRDVRVRLFVLPSLPAVPATVAALAGTSVLVGAQDLDPTDHGPYTGAVSGADLRWAGCRIVTIGHAERRMLFGDDDGVVSAKVAAAVRNDLIPLLCVGEEEQGDAEHAARTCVRQLRDALRLIPRDVRTGLIVAYEPVWAIGRATPATPTHVHGVTAALRAALASDPRLVAPQTIYGGSAGPGSLQALSRDCDGLFLGRFVHDPAALARIIDEGASLFDDTGIRP